MIELTEPQMAAARKLLSLRTLLRQIGTITTCPQSLILRALSDTDLIAGADYLAVEPGESNDK